MTTACENDELFREASCNGDIESLNKFLEVFAVDINCTNKVNGWTALHWACKRNHFSVVQFLLQKGANKDIQTSKGEEPVDLTTSDDIIKLLGVTQNSSIVNQTTPSSTFTPNYLANPVFPYTQPVISHSDLQHELIIIIYALHTLTVQIVLIRLFYFYAVLFSISRSGKHRLGIRKDRVCQVIWCRIFKQIS
jgi:hypothetical protein